MIRLTSWKLWVVVGGLLMIDLWLLGAMVFKPVKIANSDQSQWDFRIAELRQLETSDGHYTVVKPTDAATGLAWQTDFSDSPAWLRRYFPGQSTELGTAVVAGWRIALPDRPVAKDMTNQADAMGQIL
jgi:hypothetical protein